MMDQNDLEKRTLTLHRTFKAPRKLVWEAWTQPEHIAQWWGPKGMEVKVIRHDFQIGGSWEYTMTMPNGGEFITEGVYSKIIILELIESSADFKPMTEGVTIVAQFKDAGSSTDFTFKVIHPTEEYCRQQEDMGFMSGWGGVFDNLEGFLEGRIA